MEKIVQAIINSEVEVDLTEDHDLDMIRNEDGSYNVLFNNRSYSIEVLDVLRDEKWVKLSIDGEVYDVELKDEVDALVERLGFSDVTDAGAEDCLAPMPGLVLSVDVEKGAEVESGQPLLILEAMKMENVIKSAHAGVIDEIRVVSGDKVEKGQVLITYLDT